MDARPSVPWEESMLRGANFSSIPDKGIIYLGFPASGNYVAATVGDRNDALAAPIWYWSIDSKGVLVLTEDDDGRETVAKLDLIMFSNNEVTVRNHGVAIRYRRTEK